MKTSINTKLKTLLTMLSVAAFQVIAFAQDSTMQTTQTTSSASQTTTTVQPWMWIVGAAIVLLILVALFRGKSTNTTADRVTVTKSVQRDTDV